MRKFLVLTNHGLGDVIMTLPLLAGIVGLESARLTVVVKSATEKELLELVFGKGCAEILVLPAGNLRRALFLARFSLGMRRFDYAIVGFNINYTLASLFMALVRADTKLGRNGKVFRPIYDVALPEEGIHKADYSRLQAEACGIEPREVTLYEDAQPVERVVVALSSGGRPPAKDMDLPSAIAVTRNVVGRHPGSEVVLVGGAKNKTFNSALAAAIDSPRLKDLTGETTLDELLKLLAGSRSLYTTCNGVSHLASLVGCRVVGFYGPTDPAYTGPQTDKLSVVSRHLPCSPCYSRTFRNGCGNPVCMKFAGHEFDD